MAAIATAPPPQAPQQPPPQQEEASIPLESLTHIDITTLSQSELHVLSLCFSSATFNNDLLIPKIDPSLFNESAGFRSQTFSRPGRQQQSDASTAATTGRRRRVSGVLASPNLKPAGADDPERNENRVIIAHLKHLISQDPKFDLQLEPSSNSTVRRGRKGKAWYNEDLEMEMANDDSRKKSKKIKEEGGGGGEDDDPYGEELRRRTAGMQAEEDLLRFMRDKLGGQWGSRRKKRKIENYEIHDV